MNYGFFHDSYAAIQHRLNTAGLKRKIGKNQVQAIRIVLTGTHADMEQIEQTVKKRYRTKAPAPRLCADEVMSRAHSNLFACKART